MSKPAVTEIKNVIPDNYLKALQKEITFRLTWQFQQNTTYGEDLAYHSSSLWDRQMSASFIQNNVTSKDQKDPTFSFFFPLLYILEKAFGVTFKYIERMKVNMMFTCPENIEVKAWHTDTSAEAPDLNFKTILVYLNDSDGGTVVANATKEHPGQVVTEDNFNPPQEDIIVIEFEKNKAVMFDSNLLHYGQPPVQHKNRIVLNLVVAF